MDFLQKAYSQIVDALRPMSPGAKITTGLMLVLVVGLLVYLYQYEGTTANAPIFGGRILDDGEVTDVLAAFSAKGLKDWRVEGNRILVPYAKRAEYLAAASEANARPEDAKSLWDPMLVDSFWQSRESRRVREKYTTKRELERMLKEMSGVSYASVQFKEKKRSGLLGETENYALIAVRGTNKRKLSSELVETIRNSSASALGMEPQSVTVTDMANGRAYSGPAEGSTDFMGNAYLRHKEMLEESYEETIYDQLVAYPGVIVNVHVDVEPRMKRESNAITFSDPAAYETNNFSEEQTTRNVAVGGAPGAAANGLPNTGGVVAASSASSSPENSTTITREQSRSIVSRETVKEVMAPFTPTKITAAITLPDTYPLSVWNMRNPPVEGEEPQQPDQAALTAIEEETETKIQELVKNLLPPVAPGADPYPDVAVAFTPQLPVAEPDPPSMMEVAGYWLDDHWQSIAMLLAAFVALFFLRGMIKSAQRAAAEASQSPLHLAVNEHAATIEEEEEEEQNEETIGVLKAQFKSHGPNLQDELSEMVREDPDSAANVLRAWIGDAA